MSYDARPHKFANNAYGTLTVAITSAPGAISITPATGSTWPSIIAGEIFKLAVVSLTDGSREIMHCTSVSGNSLTVERGQEGTAALAFPAGSLVQHCITAGTLEWFEAQV